MNKRAIIVAVAVMAALFGGIILGYVAGYNTGYECGVVDTHNAWAGSIHGILPEWVWDVIGDRPVETVDRPGSCLGEPNPYGDS